MIREAAPAKVNLYLRVTGRRADGYHLLDSLAVFGPAADLVEAAPAEGLTLTVAGPFGAALAAEPDNLVLRAARALAAAAGIAPQAALRLEKRLPVASGIGGGSADAAAALRALDRLWGLGLGAGALAEVAAGLGADVPVCLASRPARMGGVGEALLPAPALPPCGLLLVNPGVPLATPAVFRARSGPFSAPAALPEGWADAAAMARDLAALGNDLEAPARALCPAVGEVLAALRALPGCLLARMSGSGATCFALFADAAAAERAAAELPGAWWRAAGAPGGFTPGRDGAYSTFGAGA
ncbi:4-(cytidine 5'-diphospho)-2-C-methyl-D-erythritol kinase [Crenalkalicoccus roseus]|uniref:4-(cytidine 5'-diphospho)-2-C-methyl-D-erythritol kinase n=1 Tax=Crenalkalicoccus roseus TaxID=1485588 RepID=UPI001080035E|nr:4-(cytidine 5'-diphospho)-2-C-methyl-D-erythritol kinase [Crenalkalicoccus roseus]